MVCLSIFQLIHHYELESISPQLVHTRILPSRLMAKIYYSFFTHIRTSWVRCRGTSLRVFIWSKSLRLLSRSTHIMAISSSQKEYHISYIWGNYLLTSSLGVLAVCAVIEILTGKIDEKMFLAAMPYPHNHFINNHLPLRMCTDDDEKYSKCLNLTNLFSEIWDDVQKKYGS